MASVLLTIEQGNFNVFPTGVELFHGQITFVVIGQDTLLFESPLFKLRGIDVEFSIGGSPSIGKPKPRTKKKYELRGGGPSIVPVQEFPGRISTIEEEELMFIIYSFLQNIK